MVQLSLPRLRPAIASLFTPLALLLGSAFVLNVHAPAQAQQQTMQLRANVTEANSKTGVVVARGNVQITYAARQIEATAAQAVYFSKEGKIVLSGDVNILQEGNRLRGETVTYLVNEGRFVALPQENSQVEATYLIKETPTTAPAPVSVPTNPAPIKPIKLPFPSTTAPKLPGAVPVVPEKP